MEWSNLVHVDFPEIRLSSRDEVADDIVNNDGNYGNVVVVLVIVVVVVVVVLDVDVAAADDSDKEENDTARLNI